MTASRAYTVIGTTLVVLAHAVPAAAQYRRFPHPNGYGGYRQIAVNRCAEAVQWRLGVTGAGDPRSKAGRVIGITGIDLSAFGAGVTVRGLATSGRFEAESRGSHSRSADLAWQCTTDDRGQVVALGFRWAAPSTYGYSDEFGREPGYEGEDYSQYGYRRY